MAFIKAKKSQGKLRLAFMGTAGSGKTYSALKVARGLGSRIAMLDTEHGSASKYAGDVADFDVLTPESFGPRVYIQAIKDAEAGGYDVLILDSLSSAWAGAGGLLEQVDQAAKRNQGNSYVGWRDATPQHNALIDAILGARLHIIATLRSKTEYVLEKDHRGKIAPRKVGMAPVQRDGLEYEFDVVGEINPEHELIVTKSRCSSLADAVIPKPDERLGATLLAWLSDGEAPREAARPTHAGDSRQIHQTMAATSTSGDQTQPNGANDRVEAPADPMQVLVRYRAAMLPARDAGDVEQIIDAWAPELDPLPVAWRKAARIYADATRARLEGREISAEQMKVMVKLSSAAGADVVE